jgi:hypothetical protein
METPFSMAASVQSNKASFRGRQTTLDNFLHAHLALDPRNDVHALASSPYQPSTRSLTTKRVFTEAEISTSGTSVQRPHLNDVDADSRPKPVTSAVRAVVCVSRTSGHQDIDFVAKLRTNNERMYRWFQQVTHPYLHDCTPDQCIAEFISIVLNGFASNTNMTTRSGTDLTKMTNILEDLLKESSDAPLLAVVMFSSLDGLFTNLLGMRDYFSNFRSLNLLFYMYCGNHTFQSFSLNQLLPAIEDVLSHQVKDTALHQLLQKIVLVSVNKVILSQAHCDNRQLMPRKRNNIDLDPTNQPEKQVVRVKYNDMNTGTGRRTTPTGVQRYELEQKDGKFQCPEAGCAVSSTFDNLIDHLVRRSEYSGECVLCPSGRTLGTYKQHILAHLPSQLKCPKPGCDFVTNLRGHLNVHIDIHRRSEPAG